MISCTDFIPAYSEVFRFMQQTYGRQSVDEYWRSIFKPGAGIPLSDFVDKEGLKGCFTYWSGTLNEEAADFSMYLNEKRGFFKIVMHRCPSKGRLLELQERIGYEPYDEYCLHCDCYRAACEKAGLCYIYDFENTDRAGCSILIYDPQRFDGRVIIDGDTRIMRRTAADNVYFHPNFHFSLNRSIHYVAEHYGREQLRTVLYNYTDRVIVPLMGEVTLESIEQKIRADYEKERAPGAVRLWRDKNTLTVEVSQCPAVDYMRTHGLWVSPWYGCCTHDVMDRLAQKAGCRHILDHYDQQTGASRYLFIKE